MKKLALILFIAVSAIVVTSCEHCSTCSYTYRFNGVDSTRAFAQECGSKKDIEKYETDIKTESVKLGGKVTCTEE